MFRLRIVSLLVPRVRVSRRGASRVELLTTACQRDTFVAHYEHEFGMQNEFPTKHDRLPR
jgi:hypothetical protein